VPDTLLQYKSAKAAGECHYDKQVNEKLILNLPPSSVTVLHNVSYHSVLLEKNFYSNSAKQNKRINNIMADKDLLFCITKQNVKTTVISLHKISNAKN
jgi:hypothetical protein